MSRPTMKDIAARAGVSISTVSYALNEQSRMPLSATTKARIRELAREVGYVPNSVARALQARSSRTIGVLLNKPLTTPRYAAIAQGLSDGLAARGFHLALLDGESADRCVEDARGGRLEGLVFIGHDDHEVPTGLAAQITTHRIPFVTLDCGPATGSGRWPTVDFDYRAGAAQVIEHLRSVGVTRVLHVRPDVTSRADRARVDAVRSACAERDMSVRPVATGLDDARLVQLDGDDPLARSSYAAGIAQRLDAAFAAEHEDASSTALLCSWGADVETVYGWAARRPPRLPVAALAAGVLDPSIWPGLAYSRLPLIEAGLVCAEQIVRAIRDSAADSSTTDPGLPSDRTLLVPTLDTGASRI